MDKYLVIEDIKEESEHSSGLSLSSKDTNKIAAVKAKVVQSGENVDGINESDKIMYHKARAFKMVIEGEIYTMIREQDILVVL